MDHLQHLADIGSHALHLVADRASGLRAIVAIDSVVDGRSVGGIRCRPYADEAEATTDALRLARTMSLKAAMAGLPCGGAKCVVIEPQVIKREAAFRALGRAIEALGGLYHSGSDLGTSREDLEAVARETRHVSSRLDFGKHTAAGVVQSIEAALEHQRGSPEFSGLRFVVQGLGEVGINAARMIRERGGALVVADLAIDRAKSAASDLGAVAVEATACLFEPCDVLVPCATGRQIGSAEVPALGCKMIVGSANNFLIDTDAAQDLRRAGILHIPDFVSSAGALIVGVSQLVGIRDRDAEAKIERIRRTTAEVLRASERLGVPPLLAAESMALERLGRAV